MLLSASPAMTSQNPFIQLSLTLAAEVAHQKPAVKFSILHLFIYVNITTQ